MITRRRFITSLAALTSAPAIDTPWASTRDSSKVALIIGNSAYPNMRLLNPANDARAMSELLGSAGFSVDTRLDATRLDLLAAIERFGDTARQSATELALFYYAGHGAQLDWRNYLLPVDARIASAEQLKQNGIDLGLLLNKLKAASGKSFVIVLDACRDDPFGSAFRTAQKGLSQFDAPVGSLLAYSTSPGNTASDGDGKNGLYTEHLVRELSAGGIRIEDALKRVRLNVRLASNGGQIPWESTSLENDIYIVGTGPKKRSDAELEKEIEDDLRDWERIKTSHDIDDWATYIRKRPNGRFAEIAQSRLIKLMARRQTAPVASSAVNMAASSAAPAIDLKQGATGLQLTQAAVNPYSAGSFPLARKFTVGDEAVFALRDILTGLEAKRYTIAITKIDLDADRVEGNGGDWVFDTLGNELSSPINGPSNSPSQFAPLELQIGKKWTAAWTQQHPTMGKQVAELDLRIATRERLRTDLGEFDTFRIDGSGWLRFQGWGGSTQMRSMERRWWIVPGINYPIRVEAINRASGRAMLTDRIDLVALRQIAVDNAFESVATGGGRSLLLKSR